MSIRILTGKPQQNEELSSTVYAQIGEAIAQKNNADHSEAGIFLIVPEQFTLGAERALMTALNQPGLIEADVMSLRRLSSRIMQEAGGQLIEMVDEQGRMLMLAKVVHELSHQFKLYRRNSRHAGFIKSLSELLTELKQNCISVDDLIQVSEQVASESWTGQKLAEMISIYRQYEAELDSSQWDIDRYTVKLCEYIRKSELLHHAKIWLDGFFTFSVNDFAILEAIAERADMLTVTLSADLNPLAKDMQIFSLCRNTAERFAEIAKRTGQDYYIDRIFQDEGHFTPYQALRDECFSFNPEPWHEETDLILLQRYRDPWEEALYTADQIAKVIRKKNWRYQDVAVLCGSLEASGPLIRRALLDLDIPSFCDLPVQISEDPLIEGFLSAIEAASSRYKENALFAYAKSGYASLPLEEWHYLENYAMAKGIRGKKWEQSFDDESDNDWDVDKLELYRKKLIMPLKTFQQAIKKAVTFRDHLCASMAFLDEIHAYDQLMAYSEKLILAGDYENAGRIRQVWNLLMSVFDQIDSTMGQTDCDVAAFQQVLKSGLSTCKIGILPNRRDVVQIIDPFRSRGGKIKAIFIIGANEGVLPNDSGDYPLLSEDDRELLAEYGLKLQDDAVFRRSRMAYSIYAQMLRATKLISLSWCLADQEGNTLQPSSLAASFCQVFPFNAIQTSDTFFEKDWLSGGTRTLDEAVRQRRKTETSCQEDEKNTFILDWYRHQPAWEKQAKIGIAAKDYSGIEASKLSEELIHGLYGEGLTLSVSRIEKYNACPFAHFMQYGLKPLPREICEVNVMDMGSLLHEVIEKCFGRMEKEQLSPKDMTEKACADLVDGVMNDFLAQPQYRNFSDKASAHFLSRKLRRVGKRTVQMIVAHLRKGEFDFRFAELPFIRDIQAPDFSQKIRLKGKIDRIDLYAKENETYIKIIDYKTGVKEIDYSQIYYGVSIQLICYLQESLTQLTQIFPEKFFLPAGAFYFHVDDPLVEAVDPVKLEEKVNEAFRMKGLFLKDDTVMQAMDMNADKKSAVFEKGSSAQSLSEDEFSALMFFVQSQISESLRGILKGEIAPRPLKTSKFDPCARCDYREICQPDPQVSPPVFSQIRETISKTQLLEKAAQFADKKEKPREGGDEA